MRIGRRERNKLLNSHLKQQVGPPSCCKSERRPSYMAKAPWPFGARDETLSRGQCRTRWEDRRRVKHFSLCGGSRSVYVRSRTPRITAHVHRMSDSDNSIGPRSAGGPSLMYTIDVERPDQNSAGRYPLISRPTQISTRIGVVQVISRLPQHSRVTSRNPD